MEFVSLRALVDLGDYSGALIQTEHELGPEPKIIRSRCLIELGRQSEAEDLIKDIKTSIDPDTQPLLYVECNLNEGAILIAQAKYEDARQIADNNIEILGQTKPKTKELSSFVIELHIRTLTLATNINLDLGEIEVAYQHAETAIILALTLNKNLYLLITHNSLGLLKFQDSEFGEANEYFMRAQSYYSDEMSIRNQLLTINNLAMIKHSIGNLNEALNDYKLVLSIARSLNSKTDISMALNNVAEIYVDRGDLNLALNYYKECLELDRAGGSVIYKAYSTDNIALVHEKNGDFVKAAELYLQVYHLFKELENDIEVSLSLSNLIRTSLYHNNLPKAEEYIKELKVLTKSHSENKTIEIRFEFSQALISKNGDRVKDKVVSADLFKKIYESEYSDYQMKYQASLNICDLLVEEIKLYGVQDAFDELIRYSEQIHDLAIKTQSYTYIVESYIIKANVAIIDLNPQEAKSYLSQAHQLALEKSLYPLAIRASIEYDNLLDKLHEWNQLIGTSSELKERMELSGFQESINTLLTNQYLIEEPILKEHPVMFMIVSNTGVARYNYNFSADVKVNEQLIAALLTSLNYLSQEAFDTGGHLERVKHDRFTIVFKTFHNLIFSYAFEGNSFFAVQHLEEIIAKIEKIPNLITEMRKQFFNENKMNIETMNEIIESTILTPTTDKQQI